MNYREYFYAGRELGLNEELVFVRRDEDGDLYQIELTRTFFIDDQPWWSGRFREFYMFERMDAEALDYDGAGDYEDDREPFGYF